MNSQRKVVERMVDRFADHIVDCVEESDIDRLMVFQREAFGDDARQSKPRFTHWAYMRLHGSRLSYCERDGDIVGQQGRLRTTLHVGAQAVPAVWATDLRVRDDWKMKGLGVALIGQLLRDYPVVMALGLSEEARKMFRRQGWIVLGRIDALLKPLSPRGFQRSGVTPTWSSRALGYVLHWICRPLDLMMTSIALRTRRDIRIEPVARLDEAFKGLLARRRKRARVSCKRSVGFLNWRFVDCPVAHRYQRFALRVGKDLRGFVVLRRAERFGKDVMYIDELIADDDVLRKLVAFVIRESCRLGVDAVYYEGLGEAVSVALRKWGFLRRDTGHFFVVHTRNDALSPDLADRSNWVLTFADSDMGFRHDR